jgi:nucleoid-associated protein
VNGEHLDFSALTLKMMKTLQLQAQRRTNAAGGHVFFAHFERDGQQFLLVAIVHDKLGAALTLDMDVQDVQHLDMDGFRFAGRININGWLARESRYIGFLKGKGDVSDYFKEFLGCEITTQDRKDTSDLVAVLKEFTEDQKMSTVDMDNFLNHAKAICERLASRREALEFTALANELVPSNPTALLNLLTDPIRELNDGFIPHRRALNSLVKFKAKTPLWSVEFDREAITGGSILYNPNDNTLTIKDLPQELSEQLRVECESVVQN